MLAGSDVAVFVLAGGEGARLRPLTERRCKPAVYFGGSLRVIDFTLMNCVASRFRHVHVLTQYRAESLEAHCRMRWGFLRRSGAGFVETLPPRAGRPAGYRGTADAVYQNLARIPRDACAVLILSGDHVYHAHYRNLLAEHLACGADVTVLTGAVPAAEASSFGVLSCDRHGCITGFVEKPSEPHRYAQRGECAINLGVYAFRPRFLAAELELDAASTMSSHDFGRDVLPRVVARGARVRCCMLRRVSDDAYWRDVGTLGSFFRAHMDLVSSRPTFQLENRRWPREMPFRDWLSARGARSRSGGGRASGSTVDARGVVCPGSIVCAGASVERAFVRHAVISARVRVHAGARVEQAILFPGASVGEDARLRGVIVEEGVHIPAGAFLEGTADAPLVVAPAAPAAPASSARAAAFSAEVDVARSHA